MSEINNKPSKNSGVSNVLSSLYDRFVLGKKAHATDIGRDISNRRNDYLLRESKKLDEIAKNSKKVSAVEIQNKYLKHVEWMGVEMEILGEEDGKGEINPQLAKDFIESRAIDLQKRVVGDFEGRCAAADKNKEAKVEIYDSVKKDKESQKEYVDSLEKKYRWDYKDFAVSIGILYVLAFIVFSLADYPLSKLIIQQGFEIENENEAILLAVGITFIGIYFKIWWDEFMSYSIEKSATEDEPKNLEGVKDQENLEDLETKIKTVKRVRQNRFILKTAILVVSLATIGILGFFRFQVYLYENFILQQNEVPSALASGWAVSGFVLISLVFPFLSGICLSLGLDRIQNWLEYRRSKRMLKNLETECRKAFDAKTNAEKEEAFCKKYLNWSEEQLEKYCKRIFISRYNHGYELGVTNNNLNMDYFSKAVEIRKRIVGKNTFEKTQTIVQKDSYIKVESETVNNVSNLD